MRSDRPHCRLLVDETRLRRNFRRTAETLEVVQPHDRRKAQYADIVESYCMAIPSRLGPITEPGLRVLLMLWRYGELAPAELAELVDRDVTNVSRAVDRLAGACYVTVQRAMSGGRLDYRLASINDRGHSALDVLVEYTGAALDAATNAMDRRPQLTPAGRWLLSVRGRARAIALMEMKPPTEPPRHDRACEARPAGGPRSF